MSDHRTLPAGTLDRLYRQHHDRALRRLRRTLGRDQYDAAEDALADAWVILARHPRYLRADGAELTAWLVTVARRLTLRAAHQRRGIVAEDLDRFHDRRSDVERRAFARLELAELLDTLTTGERYRPGSGRAVMTAGRRRAVMGGLIGLSYAQQMAATGLSRRQVDRGLTEGRRVLRDRRVNP